MLDFKGVCNILVIRRLLNKIDNIRAYTTLTQCDTARFEGTGFGLGLLSYGMKVVAVKFIVCGTRVIRCCAVRHASREQVSKGLVVNRTTITLH